MATCVRMPPSSSKLLLRPSPTLRSLRFEVALSALCFGKQSEVRPIAASDDLNRVARSSPMCQAMDVQ
jgi:hypothetical protein